MNVIGHQVYAIKKFYKIDNEPLLQKNKEIEQIQLNIQSKKHEKLEEKKRRELTLKLFKNDRKQKRFI